jgi:hypothetical protein
MDAVEARQAPKPGTPDGLLENFCNDVRQSVGK